MSSKPRKIVRKIESDETKSLEPSHTETAIVEEPKPVSNTVKVKVLTGTLSWEGTHFQKGEIFVVSREKLAKFDLHDIQILE
jgi:hypothetical protein